MANRESGRNQEILQNCLLTLNNHTFHVNLMPMIIGSFDVLVGMNWLSPHRSEILCYNKEIELPLPNGEPLMIYGDKTSKYLRIISCIKS